MRPSSTSPRLMAAGRLQRAWCLAAALGLVAVFGAAPSAAAERASGSIAPVGSNTPTVEATPASAPAADRLDTSLLPLPYQSHDKTLGTVNCASSTCHGSIVEWHGSQVLQNEYVTYERLDKHTRAYEVLGNERSRRIARNLKLPDAPQRSPLCLDCHAHNVPEALRGARFNLAEGVVCEACHGPAERWITTHVEPHPSHLRNIENGLYPTDDPDARARLCLSCHFGNRDKLVTHRMMGAGHPRLSFELETFSMIEPAHFRLAGGSQAERWDGVKIWAIGQAFAVADMLDILVDPKRGHDGLFPELVLFDCHACHHPMSEMRWQPHTEFGVNPGPGVARLNDSNLLMMRVIARAVDPELGRRVTTAAAGLQEAVAGQGDVAAAVALLKPLAFELAHRLDGMQMTPALMKAIALGLVDEGLDGHYADYAGAEQAAMSIGSVVDFSNRLHLLAAPAAVDRALARLYALLKNDEAYRPADFAAALKTMREALAQS